MRIFCIFTAAFAALCLSSGVALSTVDTDESILAGEEAGSQLVDMSAEDSPWPEVQESDDEAGQNAGGVESEAGAETGGEKRRAVNNGNNNGSINVDVVSILTLDDNGEKIGAPVAVWADRDTDETYVVGKHGTRVVVYGSNYFPTVAFGKGRGAYEVRNLFIDDKGMIYVCQGNTSAKSSRVTVYNQAFFREKEYTFEGLPVPEDFVPTSVVVNPQGEMYVTGMQTRGVLVLDHDGNFSHWLKPTDVILDKRAYTESQRAAEEEEAGNELAEELDTGFELSDLPSLLQPKKEQSDYPDVDEPGVGPVIVTTITSDRDGNLYLLSAETGKVYVYSEQDEYLFSFGEKGGSTGKMSRPSGIVLDPKRNAIFVSDYMRHAVLIYDMSGRFMYEFGGLGFAPGWFQYPAQLAMNRDSQLLVADRFNNRVQVLDVQFEYKYPLFQVPFVDLKSRDLYQPLPITRNKDIKRYYGPGFGDGDVVSADDDDVWMYLESLL